VNFSTSFGHDSLNRVACENRRAPNDAIIKNARIKVIIIDNTRPNFLFTKKLTTGCNRMEINIENISGIIMPCAIYNIDTKANRPTKKNDAFA